MRILDRYLIKGFLWPFAYCLAIFTTLFIVIDTFNHLDEFLKSGVTFEVLWTYYFYLLPAVLINIVPIAVLVAILYKLGNLNRHNEIVALKASGVSSATILLPYLFLGALISFGIFLINETVLPKTALTSTSIREGVIEKGRKDVSERALKNVALVGKGNRMIFARELELSKGTLYDMSVFEGDPSHHLSSVLKASRAAYEGDDRWTLTDAVRYKQNPRGDLIGEPSYSAKLEVRMPERPEDFVRSGADSNFMSAKELKEHIDHLGAGSKKLTRRLLVDFHNKIAFPFVSLVVMLIGAPLAMRTERGSALVGIGTSLVVVLLYYGINSMCLAMGKGGALDPALSAWLSNFVFAAIGIYLIRRAT